MKRYKEDYRGYTIQRIENVIRIYDKNGMYMKTIESKSIHAAKIKIDEMISRNR